MRRYVHASKTACTVHAPSLYKYTKESHLVTRGVHVTILVTSQVVFECVQLKLSMRGMLSADR